MRNLISMQLAVLIVLTSGLSLSAQTGQRKCRVKSVIGTVKVRRGDATTWSDARVGLPLREQDAVRTFVESEAELETSEGSVIKVGENSTLEMTALRGGSGAQETKVKILNGSVLSNVKKLVNANSRFEFETPTATAAIRGTVVGFDVTRERTQVRVYEGRVLVTPQGARQGAELKENQMTSVVEGQRVIKIERFDAKTPAGLTGSVADSSADSSAGAPAVADSTRDSTQRGADSLRTPSASDSARTSQSGADSSKAPAVALRLTLTAPTDAMVVGPGEQIPVTGNCTPVAAKLAVNGRPVVIGSGGVFRTSLAAPEKPGDFEIVISAESGGSTQSVTRRLSVQAKALTLSVVVPRDGQQFSKPLIPVTGTVTAGASVSVSGITIPVGPAGNFSGQVPIPDEQTELQLEIEASLGSLVQKVTRRISYQPEFRFTLVSPTDRQIVNSTMVQVRGDVMPASAEVTIMGRRMQVLPAGTFTGVLMIPDEEGDVQLDIEVVVSGKTRSEVRTITYKRPVDMLRPLLQGSLPAVSDRRRLTFTVLDRTVDDEITFFREIDGVRESETGAPNTPFSLDLVDGVRQYAVYAIDKAGNKSERLAGKVAYLESSVWRLRMRKPLGDQVINLPPSSPAGDFQPRYTVELSIENLPDDNMALIKEVTVANKSTGENQAQRIFTDNDLSFDVVLDRRQPNVIVIQAVDTNNQTKIAQFQILVR